MKKILIITICSLFLLGAAFYLFSASIKPSNATALGGVVDFKNNAIGDKILSLDGEWEFYYGHLYTPLDFENGVPEGMALIEVPMSWNRAGYPLHGYATYRLTINTDEHKLLMFIPSIPSSSMVWINGVKLFEAGVVSRTAKEATSSVRNAFTVLVPEDGKVEIIIQAANYEWIISGLVYSFEISRAQILINKAIGSWILEGLYMGTILLMSVFLLLIYIFRRKEWGYLLLSLHCLSIVFLFVLRTNGMVMLLFPKGMGFVLTAFAFLTNMFLSVTLLLFIHSVFAIPLKGKPLKFYAALYGLSMLDILVLNDLLNGMLNLYLSHIYAASLVVVLYYALRSKRYKANPYNNLYIYTVTGFLLTHILNMAFLRDASLSTAAFHDVLASYYITCVIIYCLMLSRSYVETKASEEELQLKTKFYRRVSHKLRTPLTVISTSIQTAKRRPEKAEELLTISQAKIMEMAEMIEDALKDGDEEAGND